MSAALELPESAPELCRNGLHPRAPETTYVHPVTGATQCRPCYNEARRRRDAVRRAGLPVHRRRPEPAFRVLSPDELKTLRAQVACAGCGAVREERPGAKKPAVHQDQAPARLRGGPDPGARGAYGVQTRQDPGRNRGPRIRTRTIISR